MIIRGTNFLQIVLCKLDPLAQFLNSQKLYFTVFMSQNAVYVNESLGYVGLDSINNGVLP